MDGNAQTKPMGRKSLLDAAEVRASILKNMELGLPPRASLKAAGYVHGVKPAVVVCRSRGYDDLADALEQFPELPLLNLDVKVAAEEAPPSLAAIRAEVYGLAWINAANKLRLLDGSSTSWAISRWAIERYEAEPLEPDQEPNEERNKHLQAAFDHLVKAGIITPPAPAEAE